MRIRLRSVLIGLVTLLLLLVVGAITAVGWEVVLGPKARPVTARTFERTPERLTRGEYLVELASCFHCHSDHDLSTPELPRIEAKKGAGWTMPIPELGRLVAPNITPDPVTGIGAWSDDEIARAIQEGVSRDGRALFPVMPYMNFRNLADEDLASIVAYLRTIPPVRHEVPKTELIFPLSLLVNTMPAPLEAPVPQPARATPAARGEYLARTVVGCQDCHSPADDQGQPLPGMYLAGGNLFHDPRSGKPIASKNITPDGSGISHYTDELFAQTLRTGRLGDVVLSHIMPFENLKRMTDDDVRDLFAYIRSVPAVAHRVSNTEPPTLCPLCNQEHGLGSQNSK